MLQSESSDRRGEQVRDDEGQRREQKKRSRSGGGAKYRAADHPNCGTATVALVLEPTQTSRAEAWKPMPEQASFRPFALCHRLCDGGVNLVIIWIGLSGIREVVGGAGMGPNCGGGQREAEGGSQRPE